MTSEPDESVLTPGLRFVPVMQWRLKNDEFIWAGFELEIVTVEAEFRRLLCRLTDLKALRTSVPPEEVDPVLLIRVHGLVGRYARIPYEAFFGTKLALKLETLTGLHHFFFDLEAPAG